MKIFLVFLCIFLNLQSGRAQELSYYLPANVSYYPAIPTPRSIIFHEVGEWHITHDRLVNYMKAIDAASDRVTLQVSGYTHEGRPQLMLFITSPANHNRLEDIRLQHVRLSDPKLSGGMIIDNMPAVVWMGYSIHGNEPSGSNAALLAAYYLAAARGPAVDDLLANTVILLDPSFNPDGLNRFATWANMNKSKTPVTDPNAREFNEPWPGGRFNHYWFDINRDWLPAQHPESRNRLKIYHDWKPNILTDHHEQGSNATYFFQPGVPSRTNPNTPLTNQELTGKIGNFHAKALDSIGSLYFTKEGYDDFYYGKGSTYPDINGGIGILFEQASSRGHAQETDNGLLTFPFTIRNQFTTTLSTLEAARNMRRELLSYQRTFNNDVVKEAAVYQIKGYVFGNPGDEGKTNNFINMLMRHKIDVFALKQPVNAEGRSFSLQGSYIVPTNQPQFKIIKTMFEKTLEYKDSLFYDVSAWTMPLAFNLRYGAITGSTEGLVGNKIITPVVQTGKLTGGKSDYAYLFRWEDHYAPKLLYALQAKGLSVKVATQKTEAAASTGNTKFDYGSILVPARQANKTAEEVYRIIEEAARVNGVDVYSIRSGLAAGGIDIGSSSFAAIEKPVVMMFGGSGTSATDAGEIWHTMDQQFSMPLTITDVDRFNLINPAKYNVMIMPSGNYANFDKNAQDKLRTWVSNGGTLIATEDAVKFLSTNGFTKITFRTDSLKKDTTTNFPYAMRTDEARSKDMTGSIFEAKLDITHPLGYGYTEDRVSVIRSGTVFMDQNNNAYDSPLMYTDNPLQSGYLYRGHKKLIRNSAVINIDQLGRGRVISMIDNFNFRGFWLGTEKIFMNAVFFGNIIRL
ncbi:MAG: M14 family metallopeptidase [Ferruginibacter sp.]